MDLFPGALRALVWPDPPLSANWMNYSAPHNQNMNWTDNGLVGVNDGYGDSDREVLAVCNRYFILLNKNNKILWIRYQGSTVRLCPGKWVHTEQVYMIARPKARQSVKWALRVELMNF